MPSVIDVANHFIVLDEAHDGDGLSNMKLQKLAYYAQGFHLALHDSPLFSECIEAWEHGPVCPELYHAAKSHGSSAVEGFSSGGRCNWSPETEGFLGEVFETFGRYSAWALRNMTHEESPWKNHIDDQSEIPHIELKSYFRSRLTE